MKKKSYLVSIRKNGKLSRKKAHKVEFFNGAPTYVEFPDGLSYHKVLDNVDLDISPKAQLQVGEDVYTPTTADGIEICEGDTIVYMPTDVTSEKEAKEFKVEGDYNDFMMNEIVGNNCFIQLKELIQSNVNVAEGIDRGE